MWAEEKMLTPAQAFKAPAKEFSLEEIIGPSKAPPKKLKASAPELKLDFQGKERPRASLDGIWWLIPIGPQAKGTPGPGTIRVPDFWWWGSRTRRPDLSLYPSFKYEGVKGCVWYGVRFSPPASLEGKRLYLYFEAVSSGAEVWLNNRHVASHIGSFDPFEIDVTDVVRLGKDNFLAVKVADGNKFRKHLTTEGKVEKIQRTMRKTLGYTSGYLTMTGWISRTGAGQGGVTGPVHIEARPSVEISDVFFIPSLKGGKLEVGLKNTSGHLAEVTVKYRITPRNGGDALVKETPLKKLSFEDTASFIHSFSSLNPKLWSPQYPFLYTLSVSLWKGKELIDRKNTTIGFRTFEAKEGKFYLNGRRIFLLGGNDPPIRVAPANKALARRCIRLMRAGNQQITRFHLACPSSVWFDACDEEGMMVIYENGLVFNTHPYNHPRFWAQTRKEVHALIRRLRNHPSVVIWSMGNENALSRRDKTKKVIEVRKTLKYRGRSREILKGLARLKDYVKTIDPSRPVLTEACCYTFEDTDIASWNDYPAWYSKSFLYADKWLKRATKTLSPAEVPYLFTEYGGAYTDNNGLFTQQPLALMHIGTPLDVISESLWYQEFLFKELTEMMRRNRTDDGPLQGILPFSTTQHYFDMYEADKIRPKPVYFGLKLALSPVLVSPKCWDRHWIAGQTFSTKLHVINDHAEGKDITNGRLQIALVDSQGHWLAQKEIRIDHVKYCSNKVFPIKLPIPKTAASGFYRLDMMLWQGDKQLCRNRLKLRILNEDDLKPADSLKAVRIGVYGGDGSIAGFLHEIGLKAKPVKDWEELSTIDVLLVAPQSLDKAFIEHAKEIKQFAEKGGGVVCLEQDAKSWSDAWLPIKVELQPQEPAEFVNQLKPKHLVFEGLRRSDFRNWNGDFYVYENGYLSGDDYRKLANAFVGNKRAVKEVVVVGEIPCGKGVIYLSQLLVGKKYKTDPIAKRLLLNLLKCAAR
jgi:hypothetical protein